MNKDIADSDVKVPVTVRLHPEDIASLDALANAGNGTRSALICSAVSDFVRGKSREIALQGKTKVELLTEELRELSRGEVLTVLEQLGIISIAVSLNPERLHGQVNSTGDK